MTLHAEDVDFDVLEASIAQFRASIDPDDDVPIEESRQPMRALDRAGKPYEFVEMPGVTHVMWGRPDVAEAHIAFSGSI